MSRFEFITIDVKFHTNSSDQENLGIAISGGSDSLCSHNGGVYILAVRPDGQAKLIDFYPGFLLLI